MDRLLIDAGLPASVKTKRLARGLGCGINEATGIYLALLCWTARHREYGNLEKLGAEDIAAICGYEGPVDLFDLFATIGVIDRGDPPRIHDWAVYQGGFLRSRDSARDRMRNLRASRRVSAATKEDAEYIDEIAKLFQRYVGTDLVNGSDRDLACSWARAGIALSTVESAMILACARRMNRPDGSGPSEPIGSLAYFINVVSEISEKPLEQRYLAYLREFLERSKTK